ncbi:MAG TPA: hypothetical protein DCY88_31945 [Cyanobacteria bacterium UBA11372]|nr:hypothetical protein [Cyanobacteria bacterium UBA11372]
MGFEGEKLRGRERRSGCKIKAIAPFIARVRQLYTDYGVSTVFVMGVLTEYL